MSSGFNPYQAPQSDLQKPFQPWSDVDDFKGPWSMDYLGTLGRVTANPQWFVSCLLLGLVMIIPILGIIVGLGFMYETVSILHRTNGQYYAPFNFGRFGVYLSRGVGAFLLGIVAGIGQFIFLAAIMFGLHLALGREGAFAAGMLGQLINWVLSVGVSFITFPLQLRSGTMNNIGQAFNVGWGVSFAGRMWLEMFLCGLVYMLMFIILGLPLIVLTCGLGSILVIGFAFHVIAFYLLDLYRVFLTRGGERIPMSPDLPPLPTNIA